MWEASPLGILSAPGALLCSEGDSSPERKAQLQARIMTEQDAGTKQGAGEALGTAWPSIPVL